MLLELAIENYAVADRLRLRFHGGLNLLTGETGSGKSIVVDALALLFGGRASADVVRSGELSAFIPLHPKACDDNAHLRRNSSGVRRPRSWHANYRR